MLKIIRPIIFYNSIKIPIRITTCSFHTKLEPYVNSKYSYAFGRGTAPLVNDNINFFLDKLEQQPARDLLICHINDRRVTNLELVSDIKKLACGIYNKLRLRRGDTVCLWSLNCYDWIKVYFACQSIGVTVCTVNPYYKEQELAYALTKCKAKALFMPGSESEQCKINKFTDIVTSNHVQTELKANSYIRTLIFIDENTKQIPMDFDTLQLDELAMDQKLDKKVFERVGEDNPAAIMYTSGTTGVPKGVVLNNHSIINNSNISGNYIVSDETDAIILPLPLFHSYALSCGAYTMIIRGIKTVLTGYRFDVKKVVDAINKHDGTFIMVTPAMILDCMNYIKKNKIAIPTLKTVLGGAASFPPELYKIVKETVPDLQDLRIGYGMTETSPVISLTRGEDSELEKQTTVGQPIDYLEVKVVEEKTGQTVELNQEGELWVRGHCNMVNYFEDEEKTKEVFTPNRWLRTGDRARMNEKGFIQICGRSKEMIIKGGENIYPAEIENLLHKNPAVVDSHAFSVPDPRLGEVVGVWVQLVEAEKGKTTEDDIKAFCKERITSYKIPTHVFFTNSFPMTITGKVKKFELTRLTCEKLGIDPKSGNKKVFDS